MPCSVIIDPGCLIGNAVSSAASAAGSGFLSELARGILAGVRWIVTNTLALWVKAPSPDLTAQAPVMAEVHGWLFPVTAAVAVGGAIAAGARMAVTRKHSPLLDLTTGLAVMGLAAGLGLIAPTALMKAGDLWSGWILSVSTGGHFSRRMLDLLSSGFGPGIPQIVIILFGGFAIMFNGIQAVLLLFRTAAVVVLAAVLPLAAAGAIAPATRTWIRKIAAWDLALIFFKPAAAAVYATAFALTGGAAGLRAILTGIAMMGLSVLALPVLMRFFTWTTGTVGSGGGGGGQFFGTVASGALALGALRGGGASSPGAPAIDQAGSMNASNPQPGSPGPGGSPGASGGSGPSGSSGPAGSSGSGQPGIPGPSGSPGSPGTPGSSGSNGTAGPEPTSPPDGQPGRTPAAGRSRGLASQGAPDSSQAGPGTVPGADTGSGSGAALGSSRPTGRRSPAGNSAGTGAGVPDGAAAPASGTVPSGAAGGAQGAAAGKAAPASAGSAAPVFAAFSAAASLATGAKNSATDAMSEGESS